MGSVWVADHRALQTQVVVKFMHAQLTGDKESLLRFSREAAASANVKSPHVVQVHDHGIAPDGAPFIVMELLEGTDLATYSEKTGPMPLLEVEHVISQTCKALSRAHERGIIHRDIKPQNLFLTNVGGGEVFVKVLDFGIAKASDSHHAISSATKTGAMMGTPYYMSPEQMIGAKGIDHRTDLWGLGVVAFECLTGHKPFDAETIGGLALAICSAPMPVPSQINGMLSADVDRWFARACAREATQRFSSAKEMADALHVLVTGHEPSHQRFSSEPQGRSPSALALIEPSAPSPPMAPTPAKLLPVMTESEPATEPAPALGITTSAPTSGADDTPSFLPKRRGKGTVLAIAAAVLLVAALMVGIKLADPSPAAHSDVSAQAAESPPPVAPASPPPAMAPPSASAAVTASAPPPVAPPGASLTAAPLVQKASAPNATTITKHSESSKAAPSTAKSAPAAKSKDRDSIE
jgi:serine/threonine-protein kinase